MTLKEAIESGRPFRRSGECSFLAEDAKGLFTKEDVLAEDWELKPEEPKLLFGYIRDGDHTEFISEIAEMLFEMKGRMISIRIEELPE